jgi:AsmA protein
MNVNRLCGGSTHMLRPAIALIAAAALAGAALAIRSAVSPDATRVAVERQVSAWLGLPVALSGHAEVRLLPLPNVTFADVAFTVPGESEPRAEAQTLVARVGFTDLLRGRPDLASLTLSRPVLRLEAPPLERLPAFLAERLTAAPIGLLAIDDGRLVLTRPTGGSETIVVDEAKLTRNGAVSGVTLDAALRWRERPLTLALRLPTAGPVGPPTGAASLRLTAAGVDLDFAGATDVRGVTAGNLKATLAAPPDLLGWLGSPIEPSLFDGAVELSGRLEIKGRDLTLADARLDLSGDRGEGALSLRLDGPRPRLAGTLAFDTIDHREPGSRFLGAGFETLPVAKILPPIDLDLRLSATRVVADVVTLGRVAASFATTERRILLEIGNADLWSTAATAALRGEIGDRGLEATVRASAADLPIETALQPMRIGGIEAGRATVGIEAEIRCLRIADCLASFAGKAKIEAKALKVKGTSPFGDATRFHPVVVKAAAPIATATWDRLDADLRFTGRRATIDRLDIDGRGPRFSLSGKGDFLTGALDLVGNAFFPAFRPDPARSGGDTVTVPIRVGGSIRAPEITQRTPGAAPLGGDAPPAPAVDPARNVPRP